MKKNNKAKKYMAFFCGSLLFSLMPIAHSNLLVQDEKELVTEKSPTIEQVGLVKNISLVKKDLKDVDFALALKAIVPLGWKGFVESSAPVDKAPKVSVQSKNLPWTEVLRGVLEARGFRALINWDKKEVTFKAATGS